MASAWTPAKASLLLFAVLSLGCASAPPTYGPALVAPKASPRGFWANFWGRGNGGTHPASKSPTVTSRRPTLCWEFQAPASDDAPREARADLEELTYELRVARAGPGPAVYARAGLTGTCHTLEAELLPDTPYVWTVRAHFRLNGQWRYSAWGQLAPPAGSAEPLPGEPADLLLYRFRTPPKS